MQHDTGTTPRVGDLIADRYRVLEQLGAGAMGAVFKAEHVHMRKLVALKLLHPETACNEEIVERFNREAVAAGRIEHPNVAMATDFGRLDDGSFYLALEYVEGESLRTVLDTHGALTPERARNIVLGIVAALIAAHAEGVVHRDLKPENVMLAAGGTEPTNVKVLDFGLAKLDSPPGNANLTRLGAVYGTPHYMAPEQAAGKTVDHRADLYAVGVMLYEMLTGRPPFEADQMVALLLLHMNEPPAPLPASVPADLASLTLELLAKAPEHRPQSAAELHRRLTSGRDAEPSLGRDASAKLRGPVRPLTAHASLRLWGAVAGAALLGGFGLTWLLAPGNGGADGAAAPLMPAASRAAAGVAQKASRGAALPPMDAELTRVLAAIRAGSGSALDDLLTKDPGARTAPEWLAIAEGHLMRRKVEPALEAYGQAIALDDRSITSRRLLGALRTLADKAPHTTPILEFAAAHLQSVGADFLFHVWAKTSQRTPATTRAFELLTTREVAKRHSAALTLALELREAEPCEDIQALLPRITADADERTLSRLDKLLSTNGCGPRRKDDCYPCLRGSRALADARVQAALRKAPQFKLSRRWRWL